MGGPGVADVRAARPRLLGRVLAVSGRALTVRPLDAADLDWAGAFLVETLGGRVQARRGELVDVLDGEGAVALIDGQLAGLVTWSVDTRDAEVRAVAVDQAARGQGVGRTLLEAAEASLRHAGVARAWLVTTNDNLTALALYQKAGWRLSALRAEAIDEARRTVKPSLPMLGQHGIPLRDEVELRKDL